MPEAPTSNPTWRNTLPNPLWWQWGIETDLDYIDGAGNRAHVTARTVWQHADLAADNDDLTRSLPRPIRATARALQGLPGVALVTVTMGGGSERPDYISIKTTDPLIEGSELYWDIRDVIAELPLVTSRVRVTTQD